MFVKFASLLVSAACIVGSAHGALAADIFGDSIKDGPLSYAPMSEPGPSIYFRIDGGYSAYDDPDITENGSLDLTNPGIDDSWSLGGGVGMTLGGGFRGDFTYEHRFEADVSGAVLDPLNDIHGARRFGFESDVFLANLYYDFDFGSRFTPYLGVGVGVILNTTTGGSVDDPCGCLTGTIEGDETTNVAAAFMAGLSVKLRGGEQTVGSFKDGSISVDSGRGLFLDVGYRFLYLGETATGPITATYTANDPSNGHVAGDIEVSQDAKVDDIHAHELRVGLRYNVN